MKKLVLTALLGMLTATTAIAEGEFPNIHAGLSCPVGTTHELIVWPSVENATAEIKEWGEDYIYITWLYDEPRQGGLVEIDCKNHQTSVYLRGQGKIRAYITVPAGVKITKKGYW